MRGAHAARAALLMISCGASPWVAAGPQIREGAPPVQAMLAEGGPVTMPGGMADLCRRDPSFCAPAPGAVRPMAMSAEAWVRLGRVNTGVNHAIAATTDRKLYGRDEYWTLPATAGDCEDFVLLKRQRLMQMGVPEALLLITVVHDENDDGHAVLTIPTDRGDLVLDNRRDEILRWWQTGYRFIKRQSEANPDRWVSLGDERRQATEIASGPGLP